MDIEEIIVETLRLSEQLEMESNNSARLYTCLVSGDSFFAETVQLGELCVCACNEQVAVLIFFLLQGIFDHTDNKLEWFTQELESCINLDYDEVTPEVAMKLWTNKYKSQAQITSHNISQPIVVHPMDEAVITMTPSICDIWTLPRIYRQFTD